MFWQAHPHTGLPQKGELIIKWILVVAVKRSFIGILEMVLFMSIILIFSEKSSFLDEQNFEERSHWEIIRKFAFFRYIVLSLEHEFIKTCIL